MSFLIEKFQDRPDGFHAYVVHGVGPPTCGLPEEGFADLSPGRWDKSLYHRYLKNRKLYPVQGMCYSCLLRLTKLHHELPD